MPTREEKIDSKLDEHEKRIQKLEVAEALLTDHMKSVKHWARWIIAILGGSLVLQILALLAKH